jgi:hypothetical protein
LSACDVFFWATAGEGDEFCGSSVPDEPHPPPVANAPKITIPTQKQNLHIAFALLRLVLWWASASDDLEHTEL